jgi:hypothetical protein
MLRQAQEAIQSSGLGPEPSLALVRPVLEFMARLDWNLSPPELGQRLHCFLRQLLGNPDPYARVKERLNRRAVTLYPTWRRRFQEAFSPLEAAVRLAIVGNLLDLGAKTQMDDHAVMTAFEDSLTAPLRGSVPALARAIHRAGSILYLADNAGEIVFDRDLLAQLPPGRFALVVRGSPVLNDATLADADAAGLSDLCEVISNGSDAPGTILDDCSPAFRNRFEAADLVIAKGQGNFESLTGFGKATYFLLKVKCPVLSRALDCPVGSLVLHHRHLQTRAGTKRKEPARTRASSRVPPGGPCVQPDQLH